MIYLAIIFSILVLLDGEVRRRCSYLHTFIPRSVLGWVFIVWPLCGWSWSHHGSRFQTGHAPLSPPLGRWIQSQVCETVYAPSSQLIVSPPPVWEHEQRFDRVLKDWKRDWSLLLRPNLSVLSITSQKRPLVISYLQRTELTS